MPKIIVSYRRSDSAATAGRIYDHLVTHFGQGSVFMDVDAIPFGTDFRSHIRSELLHSDILLAVIGPRWLGVGADGSRRIDDEADPVRVEVEIALQNNLAIVPVLIDGTPMPGAAQLPEALREMAFLNAAPVDMGRDFRSHMERLSRALDGILAGKASVRAAVETTHQPTLPPPLPAAVARTQRRPALAAAAAIVLAAGLGAVGWIAWGKASSPPTPAASSVTASRVDAPAAAITLAARDPDAAREAPAEPKPSPAPQPAIPQPTIQPPPTVQLPPAAKPSAVASVPTPRRGKGHGTFAWYELWTTNAPAAQAFYRSVVGWNASTSGYGDAAYTMLFAGPSPVAGLATLPPATVAQGARPNWVGYVTVTDVDSSAAQAKDLGAIIYRAPSDVPGVGRYALIADPQGAYIVLFKGLTDAAPPPATPTSSGFAGWRELQAADRDTAFDFYAKLFGWTKAEPQDVTAAGSELFAVGSDTVGAIKPKPASMPAAAWTYYFQVDGLAAAVARVRASGGTIVDPPQQVAGGNWVAGGLDPQGAAFALTSRSR